MFQFSRSVVSDSSPPALNLSQHQGLFQWVSSSHQVTKVLELPVNIHDWFPLGLTGWISLQSKGLSRVFSSTTDQKHRFFGTLPSLWSDSHVHWVSDAYLTSSSSAAPFSFCLKSFPASESFRMSPFFASGSQSIGVSASASVLPMNIQD